MIEDLRIRGFRGIEELDLTKLGRMNLVVGQNGSCKTTLLRAAYLFGMQGDARLVASVLPQTTELAGPGSARSRFGWLLHRSGRDHHQFGTFEVKGRWDGQDVETEVTLAPPPASAALPFELQLNVPMSHSTSGTVSHVSEPTTISRPEDLRRRAEVVVTIKTMINGQTHHSEMIYTPSGESYFGDYSNVADTPKRFGARYSRPIGFEFAFLPKLVDDARQAKQLDAVVGLLQLFDPAIRGIHVGLDESASPIVRLEHDSLGDAPLAVFGTGVVSALQTALFMTTARGGVALLDEFDASLHVSMLRPTMEFLFEASRSLDVQVFAATHRDDTLSEFARRAFDHPDDVRLIQMASRNGSIEATVLDGSQIVRLHDQLGLDLRQPA